MSVAGTALRWGALAAAIAIPLGAAVLSPLLAWRDPIYITAGFAGVVGLSLMLVQPLLIAGFFGELTPRQARRAHRWIGGTLVAAVIVHVGGLWITSPPDVIDALLFRSPTPFSAWGVVAMWIIFVVAILAALRRRLGLSPRAWRISHAALALVIVTGTVVHAVLIEGTMETLSKVALCTLVGAAALKVIADIWRRERTPPHG